MKQNAIGVFDSGVGGLTVVRELAKQLPGEKIIYFGDTAHVPYGSKSRAELIRYADEITDFLTHKGIKMLIVACNTSSSVSICGLQERHLFPIVGMVVPGSRGAVKATRNKKVGLIATEATVKSKTYDLTLQSFDNQVEVFSQACPKFVPLVEAGLNNSEEAWAAAREYLEPLKAANIDTLIYGCTHYPFLANVISQIMGPDITLVDPAYEAVVEAKTILIEQDMLNLYRGTQSHEFFASGDATSFYKVGRHFIGDILEKVDQVCLD